MKSQRLIDRRTLISAGLACGCYAGYRALSPPQGPGADRPSTDQAIAEGVSNDLSGELEPGELKDDPSGGGILPEPRRIANDHPIAAPDVSDAMRRIMSLSAPVFEVLKLSRLMHAFRLWGKYPDLQFDIHNGRLDGWVFSVDRMTRLLLNHRIFSKAFPGEEPLLKRTVGGIAVRNSISNRAGHFLSTLAHTDDLLVACAEIHLPTSHPVVCAEYEHDGLFHGTLHQLVGDSVYRFSPNQELCWTAEAFARFLRVPQWQNRFGHRFTLDEVAVSLLSLEWGDGACLGIHNIHALAALRCLSKSDDLLSRPVCERIGTLIRGVSRRLSRIVAAGRLWDSSWPSDQEYSQTDPFGCLTATGHHFEWLAMVEPELRPPEVLLRKVLERSLGVIESMETETNRDALYLGLTHYCRGVFELFDISPRELTGQSSDAG